MDKLYDYLKEGHEIDFYFQEPVYTDEEIEAMKVDDITISDIKIKTGYSIMEQHLIYKIMEDLWKNNDELRLSILEKQKKYFGGLSTSYDGVVIPGTWELFKEAEKVFKKQANEDIS